MKQIEPNCKAWYTGSPRFNIPGKEVVCVEKIDEYIININGALLAVTTDPDANLWSLDRDICLSYFQSSTRERTHIYAPIALESRLIRLDGNDDEFTREQESPVDLRTVQVEGRWFKPAEIL